MSGSFPFTILYNYKLLIRNLRISSRTDELMSLMIILIDLIKTYNNNCNGKEEVFNI